MAINALLRNITGVKSTLKGTCVKSGACVKYNEESEESQRTILIGLKLGQEGN